MDNNNYKPRKYGKQLALKYTLLDVLQRGETIFLASLKEELPKEYVSFLNEKNIKFEVEKSYFTPRLQYDYHFDGSIKSIYQPGKVFTGFIFKPIKP